MLRKVSVALAGLAAMGLAGPAMAQAPSNTGQVVVNVTVQPFVEIEIIDPQINFTSQGTGPWHNDLSGMGNTPGVHRARFEVRANASYNLLVTADWWQALNLLPNPWDGWRQVKYDKVLPSADGSYIGGTLYLDRTPNVGTITHYWDGFQNPPNVSAGPYSAEVHTWGLSAAFAPELYATSGNPNGVVGQIAPPGTYSATATITASLN